MAQQSQDAVAALSSAVWFQTLVQSALRDSKTSGSGFRGRALEVTRAFTITLDAAAMMLPKTPNNRQTTRSALL